MTRLLLLLATLFAVCAAAHAPAAEPFPRFEQAAAANARIPAILKRHGAAGIGVGVIRGGKLVWTGYYGEQAPGAPVTEKTLFNVASLMKPVAAETILRLASEGRLSLDEPMSRHWIDPDLAGDPRHEKLTARIALSHRTGFPNWRRSDPDKKLRFGADPGTKAGYSGEGYDYVARFAESKLGRPFEELVRTRVFAPIGMKSAALTRKDWMAGRITRPMDANGAWGEPNLREPARWTAADDLYVTIPDYAAFMVSVARRERLTPAIAAERETVHTPTGGCPQPPTPTCPESTGLALGWEILSFGGRKIFWHTGGDWAESTMAYIYPDTKDGTLIFVNGATGKPVVLEVLEAIEDPAPIRHDIRAWENEKAAKAAEKKS